MASRMEVVSVFVALEFVVIVALVGFVAPIEVILPALPLALVFLFALYRYLE